jgi:hypothetical protein
MRGSTIGAAIAFTCVTALLAYRVERHLNVPGDPQGAAWTLMDFRDTVYYPARAHACRCSRCSPSRASTT